MSVIEISVKIFIALGTTKYYSCGKGPSAREKTSKDEKTKLSSPTPNHNVVVEYKAKSSAMSDDKTKNAQVVENGADDAEKKAKKKAEKVGNSSSLRPMRFVRGPCVDYSRRLGVFCSRCCFVGDFCAFDRKEPREKAL